MGTLARLNPHSKESKVELVASTRDARGRLLQEGDEIILNIRGPVFFRIAQITPVLDASAPKNMVRVSVGTVLEFIAARDTVQNEFIRVRTVEEAGPGNFKLLDPPEKPRTEST